MQQYKNNKPNISNNINNNYNSNSNTNNIYNNNDNNSINNNNNTNNNNKNSYNHDIIENYRPTYGAYLSNTLPRGPYLQYKCKDLPKSSIGVLTNQNDNNSNNTIINRHNIVFHSNHEQQSNTSSLREQQQQQQQQIQIYEKNKYENQSNMNSEKWKSQEPNNIKNSIEYKSSEDFQIQQIKIKDKLFENQIDKREKYLPIDSKKSFQNYDQNIRNNNGTTITAITAPLTTTICNNNNNNSNNNIPPAKPPRLYLQKHDRTNNQYQEKNSLQNSLDQKQNQMSLQKQQIKLNNPSVQNIGYKSQLNPIYSNNNGFQTSYHFEHTLPKYQEKTQQQQLQSNSKNFIQPVMTIQRPSDHQRTVLNPYQQQIQQQQQIHKQQQQQQLYPNSELKNIQNTINVNNQNMMDIHITEPRDQIYYSKSSIDSHPNGLLAIATTINNNNNNNNNNIPDEELKMRYKTIPICSKNEEILECLSSKDIIEPIDKLSHNIKPTLESNFLNDKSQFYDGNQRPQQKINFYSQPQNNNHNNNNRNNNTKIGSNNNMRMMAQYMNEQEIKLHHFDTNKISVVTRTKTQPTKSTISNLIKSEPKNKLSSYQYLTDGKYIQHQYHQKERHQQQQQQQLKMSEISNGNDLLNLCQQKKFNMITGNSTTTTTSDDKNQLLYYKNGIDGILNINSNRNYFKFPSTQQTHSNEMNSIGCGSSIGRSSYDNVIIGVPLSPLPMMGVSVGITGRKRIQSEIKYVTLDDVMSTKIGKLTEVEIWALLCQSVQALQDLFLSDTPSTTKVLPLVKPSTIQITSRGRIVFKLTSTSQYCCPPNSNEALTNDEATYFDITAHLSPEYISSIGKKITFPETDVEKMWIYSLGTTLKNTMENNYKLGMVWNRNDMPFSIQKLYKDDINDNNRGSTTIVGIPKLEHVIKCMCEEHLQQRASLMYLLDVISKYFRSQYQIKPFSHIVMEIFKEVAYKLEKLKNPHYQLEVEKSEETDSGRSSDNCIESLTHKTAQLNNLKVVREKTNSNPYGDYDKSGTIGFAGIKNLQPKKESKPIPQLIVRRRNRETIKKRNSRRNTIDVNAFDLEKASKIIEEQEKNDKGFWNTSRSTNYLDKLVAAEEDFGNKIDKMRLCDGLSVPDVNKLKLEDNLNVKVSHHMLNQKKSEQNLIKYHSEESFLCTLPNKGPEFILKSNCPPHRSIKLNKSNNVPPQTVHVILLNGQSLHIKCNYLTTTTKDIFKAVIDSENYLDNFYLGLCALIGGDFVFLPSDLKIYKVAPQNWLNASNKKFSGSLCSVFFTLFLRIKFYLPNLKGVSSLQTRHMLYLQLRKNILEKLILCSDDDLIVLGGLALQAEMGDYKQNMEYLDYFRVSHYLPEDVYCQNKEMAKHLRNSHYCRGGMSCKEAEFNFIKYIQEMKEYGFHLYSANWMLSESTFIKIYLGISLSGITFFERNCNQITYPTEKFILNQNTNNNNNSIKNTYKILLKHFEWLEIENLCFSKHILYIVVRKLESLKAKDNNKIKFKLRMDDKKSYFAFSLASEHHQFYLKLRNSFASLKSISSELNIPITSMENSTKNIITEIKQKTSNEKETIMKIISSPSLSSSSSISEICKNCDTNSLDNNNYNIKKIQKTIPDNKNENSYTSIPPLPSTLTTLPSSSSISPSTNTSNNIQFIDEQNNRNSNCIQHQHHHHHHLLDENHQEELIISKEETAIKNATTKNNIHNIKPIKKSMLNDNRLSKLKEKFLRRTKSTAAGLEINLKNKFKKDKKLNLSTENLKELNKNDCCCDCKITTQILNDGSNNDGATKEEYQNIENECPKNRLIDRSSSMKTNIIDEEEQHLKIKELNSSIEIIPTDLNTSITSTSSTTTTGTKICSPNRNKVKMGTRVFSSQFLNKSYDNIYDRFKQFNNKTSINSKDMPSLQLQRLPPLPSEHLTNTTEDDISSEIDGGIYDTIDYNNKKKDIKNCRKNVSEFNDRQFDFVDVIEVDGIKRYQNGGDNDNNISQKLLNQQCKDTKNGSSSGGGGGGDIYSGVYCKVNKIYSTNKCSISQISKPPLSYQQQQQQKQEPYQNQGHNNIRGSSEEAYVIQSNISNDIHNHNFSINNDTISDSLLERFNNISNTSISGSERLLRKVIVIKEIIDSLSSLSVEEKNENFHKKSLSYDQQNQQQKPQQQQPSVENEMGSVVKYSTFSPGKMKTLLRSFSNIDCIRDQNNPKNETTMYTSDMEKLKWKNMEKSHPQRENLYQEINQNSNSYDNLQNYTLGISIVQGSNDNNVYVKDLIKNGPGDKAGILIGDQIIAVNSISLLNLSYMESLKLLQNTGRIVELIISQIATQTTTTTTVTPIKENSKNNNKNNNKNEWKDDCLQQSENINYFKDKILPHGKQVTEYTIQNFSIDNEHENYKKQKRNIDFSEYNRKPYSKIDSITSGTIMSTRNQNKDINHKIIKREQEIEENKKRNKYNLKVKENIEGNDEIDGMINENNITTGIVTNLCTTNVKHSKENYHIRRRKNDLVLDSGSSCTNNYIENKISADSIVKNNLGPNNISRSLPDLPKVISVLPNDGQQIFGETVEYATVLRKSQRQISNHSRKYVGPMRYPVTPKKLYNATVTTSKHNQLNQLSIKEPQVLI